MQLPTRDYMNRIKPFFRIAVINLVLMLAVVGLIVAFPIGIKIGFDTVSPLIGPLSQESERYLYPNYAEVGWAKQHFKDLEDVSMTYRDKIVWKADPLESPTITVKADGLRRVIQVQEPNPDGLLLFGGSTMWGMGTDDANTIPSLLAQLSMREVVNHAQPGYLSRQALNALVDSYEADVLPAGTDRVIVFYDGVNEVAAKCKDDDTGWGADEHSHESDLSPVAVFRPALHLLSKVQDAFDSRIFNSGYSCHTDQSRAEAVARSLVNNWISADAIARQHGDRFLAVLQPVAFLSQTRLDHLNMNSEHWQTFAEQYHAVYPAIRRFAKEASIQYHDLSGVLDVDEYFYIDFCHLSQRGNWLLASAMNNLVTDSR